MPIVVIAKWDYLFKAFKGYAKNLKAIWKNINIQTMLVRNRSTKINSNLRMFNSFFLFRLYVFCNVKTIHFTSGKVGVTVVNQLFLSKSIIIIHWSNDWLIYFSFSFYRQGCNDKQLNTVVIDSYYFQLLLNYWLCIPTWYSSPVKTRV